MATNVRSRTVRDLMSSPVVTAGADETIAATSSRMAEKKVGSVVVTEGDRVVGILTERDLIRFASSDVSPEQALVRHWMTPDPDCATPELDVEQAWKMLTERHYRHLPVVTDGRLEGLVSMRDLLKVASLRPVTELGPEVPRGLEGVVVAETTVGDVRGMEGFYHYRQYNAVDLAEQRTLEDVWYLLFNGQLPNLAERQAFMDQVAPLRRIPDAVVPLLPAIAQAGEHFVPLDALRSAVSITTASLDFRPCLDIKAPELKANALQLCAVIPTLLMALFRLRHGQEPIAPRDDLPYAANYLYMLNGEVPKPEYARAIEQYLISTIDHGFNASTFTARVIASTGADLGAAVVGAIGALSGPLHGGAPSRALDMLDAIQVPENADAWVRNAVTNGERIMGFGHRVYKTDDPRSLMLRRVAERLGGDRTDFAKLVEKTVVEVLAELKPGRQLYTNVEFYAGVVMDTCGVPREMFTPTFASSRVIGWCTHVMEQAADNRLIRPSARYIGPPPPQPVPVAS